MTEPKIEGPLFTARTHHEYMKMFDLKFNEIRQKTFLDCAAGASSFTQFMGSIGVNVRAIDNQYGENADILRKKCIEHLKFLTEALRRAENNFKWDFYKSPDEMFEERLKACGCFSSDYAKYYGERYIKADIRDIPFPDDTFDIVLSSHLLFIYDHRLNWEFHMAALREMIRVSSSEVRVYPIVKDNGERSAYVERFMETMPDDTYARIVTVDYEFRPKGNQMLLIEKGV